jgi:RNA polymerase sigma-70 factor (ECF subfamily)
LRTENEANLAIEKYADMIRRVCFIHLKNYHDAENIFQEVFLKYVMNDKKFESDEHEKAWLLRVAINACKDLIKSFFRQKVTSIDQLIGAGDESALAPAAPQAPSLSPLPDESREILDAVLKLPEKYKDVVYLHYYEGYTALEVAALLRKNENTVYTWLSRAKAELRKTLGGRFDG